MGLLLLLSNADEDGVCGAPGARALKALRGSAGVGGDASVSGVSALCARWRGLKRREGVCGSICSHAMRSAWCGWYAEEGYGVGGGGGWRR